jgi:hypothetical protein
MLRLAVVVCAAAQVAARPSTARADTLALQPNAKRAACVSIVDDELRDLVTDEWCTENCADAPDSETCADKCSCPVQAINQPLSAAANSTTGTCTSINPAIGDDWCDQNCAATPTTDTCLPMCDCPCSEDGHDIQGRACKKAGAKEVKIPPAPKPRIIGGWTNCGPNPMLQKALANKDKEGKQLPGDCGKDQEKIFPAMDLGENADRDRTGEREASFDHEWGGTAILPGRFGGDSIAPILGDPNQYRYFWLTFGGEDTDSSNWADTAEQDIIDAGANGAAFDIEGGVTAEDMTTWIKKMRKKHPDWTYVHVPKAGTNTFSDGTYADDFVGFDPENGSPDFVAPMMYYSNYNSYPKMDVSSPVNTGASEALAALKRLLDVGWPPSRTILTYQSFDAARVRASGQLIGLLPFLGKMLGNTSVEVVNYGDRFTLQGPYAGVLGWPAQCSSSDRRCWPDADRANVKLILQGAREAGLSEEQVPSHPGSR